MQSVQTSGVVVVGAGVVVVVVVGIVSLGEPSQQCRETSGKHRAIHDVGQYCATGARGPS